MLLSVLILSGCAVNAYIQETGPMESKRFFNSPEEAVEIIRDLLRNEQWEELASYYDLTGSGLDIGALNDGSYFLNRYPDAPVHPGLAGSPLKPFPPAFSYRYHENESDGIRVHLGIRIDQGDGMFQEGTTSFFLIRTGKGFRLRPDND